MTVRYPSHVTPHLGSKQAQAMASLKIVPHLLDEELPRNNGLKRLITVDTKDGESTVARIPEHFAFIIRNKTERAAMVRPSKQYVQAIKDKYVIVIEWQNGLAESSVGSATML